MLTLLTLKDSEVKTYERDHQRIKSWPVWTKEHETKKKADNQANSNWGLRKQFLSKFSVGVLMQGVYISWQQVTSQKVVQCWYDGALPLRSASRRSKLGHLDHWSACHQQQKWWTMRDTWGEDGQQCPWRTSGSEQVGISGLQFAGARCSSSLDTIGLRHGHRLGHKHEHRRRTRKSITWKSSRRRRDKLIWRISEQRNPSSLHYPTASFRKQLYG